MNKKRIKMEGILFYSSSPSPSPSITAIHSSIGSPFSNATTNR